MNQLTTDNILITLLNVQEPYIILSFFLFSSKNRKDKYENVRLKCYMYGRVYFSLIICISSLKYNIDYVSLTSLIALMYMSALTQSSFALSPDSLMSSTRLAVQTEENSRMLYLKTRYMYSRPSRFAWPSVDGFGHAIWEVMHYGESAYLQIIR